MNEILGHIFDTGKGFNTGLSIEYLVDASLAGAQSPLSVVQPGQRAPDIKLIHPGSEDTVRLLAVTPNFGKSHVLVFAGRPSPSSNKSITQLRTYIRMSILARYSLEINFKYYTYLSPLVVLRGVADFVLYLTYNEEYRNGFKEIYIKKFRNIFSPSVKKDPVISLK